MASPTTKSRALSGKARRYSVIGLLICGILLISAPAWAAHVSLATRLVRATGRIYRILKDGTAVPLTVGTELPAGTVLRSDPGAYADFAIDGGLNVRLDSQSQVTISTALREETPGNTSDASYFQVAVSVDLGRAFFNLDSSRDDYVDLRIITSPASVIARGTTLSVAVADDGQTVVSVNRGGAEVLAAGSTTFVPATYQSLVRPGNPPSPPMALSEVEEEAWSRTAGWLETGE